MAPKRAAVAGGGSGRRLRGGAARLAAALAASALAAGCAWLGPPPLPDALLAELAQRAEAARGLRFPAPIEAERLAPERVRAVLAEELDVAASSDDFARMEALEHALGLLPPALSLREALLDFQAGAVAGFYTPLRRRLYVVYDGPVEPELPNPIATVFVHELVHALQGVHGSLLDVLIGLDDHDDLAFALGALLEGDALFAAARDHQTQTGVDPLAAAELWADLDLESAAPGPEAPRLLRESFLLQYPLGYAVAEALAARGGTAALDAALGDPPLSSEELLHPEAYLSGAARRPLAWLELDAEALGLPECRVLARNSFGELGVRVWARERGASPPRAEGAAAGWDGDRAAVFECPEGQRVAWLIQFDAVVDAAEFESVAQPAAGDGLAADRDGSRILLSRGLGEAARRAALGAPEQRFANLADYLAARPQVLARAARLRAQVGR